MRRFEEPMMEIQRLDSEDIFTASDCRTEALGCPSCYCSAVGCDSHNSQCPGCYNDLGF